MAPSTPASPVAEIPLTQAKRMQSSTGNVGYDSYDSQPEDLTIETSEPPSHHTFPPVSFHSTFTDVFLPQSIPNQTTSSFVPFSFLDSHVEVEVPATLTLGTTHSSNDLLTTQTPSESVTSLASTTNVQSIPTPYTGLYDPPVSIVLNQPQMSVSKSFSHTHGNKTHTTPSVTVNHPGFVTPPKPTTSCMSTMPPQSRVKYLLRSPTSGQKSSAVPNTGAGDGATATILINGVPTRMVLLDTNNKTDQSGKETQKASLTAAQLHMTAMGQTAGWDPDEEPLYVNAKQYHRIMKRREMRAKLEASGKIPKIRKKYLYESRHKHAIARTRGNGGKFSKEN
ncbi:nuclear transcription factor Y subunit alpha-like isoform X2 [Branchiostoma lanceolatum]|uniref:nuclear transcription factor Y subunit alpha-like isoform X2 n=1 Tax=Branchiostoma lanceolatum TaxID=7740 RepID=UPI003453FC32